MAVIDQVGSSFANLDPDYRGRTIEGEVLSQDVLTRAGIEEADGLTAVTNSDSVNAVVGHIAREVYKVANVVVRNYDPRWLPMYEAFGLQVVSSTAWGAQRIEELLYQPLGPRGVLGRQRRGRGLRAGGPGGLAGPRRRRRCWRARRPWPWPSPGPGTPCCPRRTWRSTPATSCT